MISMMSNYNDNKKYEKLDDISEITFAPRLIDTLDEDELELIQFEYLEKLIEEEELFSTPGILKDEDYLAILNSISTLNLTDVSSLCSPDSFKDSTGFLVVNLAQDYGNFLKQRLDTTKDSLISNSYDDNMEEANNDTSIQRFQRLKEFTNNYYEQQEKMNKLKDVASGNDTNISEESLKVIFNPVDRYFKKRRENTDEEKINNIKTKFENKSDLSILEWKKKRFSVDFPSVVTSVMKFEQPKLSDINENQLEINDIINKNKLHVTPQKKNKILRGKKKYNVTPHPGNLNFSSDDTDTSIDTAYHSEEIIDNQLLTDYNLLQEAAESNSKDLQIKNDTTPNKVMPTIKLNNDIILDNSVNDENSKLPDSCSKIMSRKSIGPLAKEPIKPVSELKKLFSTNNSPVKRVQRLRKLFGPKK